MRVGSVMWPRELAACFLDLAIPFFFIVLCRWGWVGLILIFTVLGKGCIEAFFEVNELWNPDWGRSFETFWNVLCFRMWAFLLLARFC